MVKFTIAGTDYETKPFMLYDMMEVAPYLDRIVERVTNPDPRKATTKALVDSISDMAHVLAACLDGVTAQDLIVSASISDAAVIAKACGALLIESGLLKTAPAAPTPDPAPDALAA
jgi:hypothetical protein